VALEVKRREERRGGSGEDVGVKVVIAERWVRFDGKYLVMVVVKKLEPEHANKPNEATKGDGS